jgi:hypothetical protein
VTSVSKKLFTAYSKQSNKIVPITNLHKFLKKSEGKINIFNMGEKYLKYTV